MLGNTTLSIDTLQQQTITRVGKELTKFKIAENPSFREWLIGLAQDEAAKALFEAAQSGDKIATKRLFQLHEVEVKDYVAARLSKLRIDSVEASYVWHHVRFRVEQRLLNLTYDRKRAFVRYLLVTARHCCSDIWRENQKANEELLIGSAIAWIADNDPTPSSVAAQQQRNDAVREAIKKLQGRECEAITAHLEGKTTADIATLLNTTPGAVRALLQRIRGKLHDDLGRTSQWFSQR
jgi:RNA polymerase sigma factor (sigma-70 family)